MFAIEYNRAKVLSGRSLIMLSAIDSSEGVGLLLHASRQNNKFNIINIIQFFICQSVLINTVFYEH